jgi:cytochrome c biogenesis protein CcmG/thiol:disulfide interchange protein DsbE
MRIRWVIAGVSALALALLTLAVPLEWPFGGSGRSADGVEHTEPGGIADGEACPADAKPANLNYTLKDVNGRDVRLSEFKGKVILLDFWATWCGPCKVEIPWFVEFQEKYGPAGLQVVGVSVDDTQERLTPFVTQFKMNYAVLQGLGHDDLQEEYGPLWGIPVTMLISRDGRICSRHTGMGTKEAFESAIKSLL